MKSPKRDKGPTTEMIWLMIESYNLFCWKEEQKNTDWLFPRSTVAAESVWISITISLKFVPNGPFDCKSALVQVMDWRWTGEKPSPESMLTQFPDAYTRH